ncbi:hypothetical protein ACHWQZ_G009978 [Mnemiopsis leidyi]
MLSFEQKFDLEEVHDLIKHGDESTESLPESGLKCIGFQTDILLFCCNTVAEGKIVTKIGYYCLQEKTIHDLYVHHDLIDVLVASINPEKNLLVYARRKSQKSTSYQSCLVELINKKTFDLNIESSQTQHLLFFPWRNAKEKGNRREHLVFFIEKRRLGIIHITTTLNQSNIEVQQIQKEFLVQSYVWYQIDLPAMRLYYIYLQQKVSGGEVAPATSMFNVYQFSSRSNPEIVLAASLPLPLYPELYSDSRRHMIGPTSRSMPDSRVNITLLRPCSAIESLVVCIGYGAQYFVYLIHSGYLVECKHGEADDATRSVVFFSLAGYVFVYSPPSVLHCIDASSTHLTRNNMVFEDVPLPPSLGLDNQDFVQHAGKPMPLCPMVLQSGEPAVIVNQTTIYSIKLEPENILSRYKCVSCLPTWSFLIHLALNHLNDLKLAHKMLLHSMSAYPSTDITELIKEYLLTASHVTLSEQEDITAEILSALPYSNEDANLAVLDRNRILKISKVFQNITKPLLTAQKVLNIVTYAGPFIRFSLEDFVAGCGHMVKTPVAGTQSSSSSYNTPPLSAHSVSSNEESSPQASLNDSDDEEKILADTICNALEYHIRRRFNETVRLTQCQDAAKMYLSTLAKHCRITLSLALISAGRTPDWYPESDCILDTEPEPGIGDLLRLLDVLKYIMMQLGCPAPATFEWLHVYSAYKTLSTELFLRRLSNKSIKVTPTSVKKFLVLIPKEPESQVLCSALVASLSRAQALQALKAWDSPSYRSFTAQNYLVALRNKLRGPAEPMSDTPTYLRAHPFIPVNSFYSYLYHKVNLPDLSRKLQALSDMSMERTREIETDATLRGITFY